MSGAVAFGDARLPERFWEKAVRVGSCWVWTAAKDYSGYGLFGVAASRCRRSHIVAYETLSTPVPTGRQLDHLCRNRACVNPAHLEPVTPRENRARGLLGNLRTHCKRGHEVTQHGRCGECRRMHNLSANRPIRQRLRSM